MAATVAKAQNWLDGISVFVSAACLVHCLALPLLVAFLPAAAQLVGMTEAAHLAILLIAIPCSLFALVPAAKRGANKGNIGLGIAGLILLLAGVAFEQYAAVAVSLTVVGSLALCTAHIVNWRARHQTGSLG